MTPVRRRVAPRSSGWHECKRGCVTCGGQPKTLLYKDTVRTAGVGQPCENGRCAPDTLHSVLGGSPMLALPHLLAAPAAAAAQLTPFTFAQVSSSTSASGIAVGTAVA